MVAYTYSRVAALNFNTTPPSVAKSAPGQVYAITDTTFTTPLNVTMVIGGVVTASLSSDANGFFPDFTATDRPSVVWKQDGSSFTTVLTTTDPVPGPQGDPGTPGATGVKGDRGDLATWQADTFYPLNQIIASPAGDLVKVTTAHTSGATYDGTRFGWVNNNAANLVGLLAEASVPTRLTATQLALTYATLDGLGRQPVRKGELFLNVKDYGAIGDGIADDTTAVQAWLTAGGSYLRDVALRITAGLTLAGNNRNLFMDNAKIVADGVNITALTVTGNNCRIRAHIDGLNKANIGITVTGSGSIIENCLVENIYSATLTARGIDVITTGGCTVRSNIIRNVNSVGNASTGDGNGASRAIILTGTAAATARSVISGNVIDSIIGEEGDAIHVIFTDYLTAKTTISDNDISNVSRRYIKIQADGCRILSNTLTHDGAVPAHPANAIDLISSSYALVQGNNIGPNPLISAISCSGTSVKPNVNNIIRDNTIRQLSDKNAVSIYCTYTNESTIEGNTIVGGASAVSIGESINVLIEGNKQFGGITTSTSFSANATNTGVVMRNNVNMEAARATTATNAGTGALTEYNAKRP